MGRFDSFLKDEKEGIAFDKPLTPIWKCLLCEFIGTTMLIFVGCGAGLSIPNDIAHERNLTGVALCWAFTIATLCQTLGTYSCDINPAVTLACLTTGKTTLMKAILYIPVQCLGCLWGAYLLKLITPDDILGDFSITKVAPTVGPVRGLFIEIIITAFLLLIIFSASDHDRKDLKGSTCLSIGLAIGGIILFAAPFTGASMNPARSIGPSIVANHFEHHWVFWLGPIVGGQIGAHLYQLVLRPKYPTEKGQAPHPAAV